MNDDSGRNTLTEFDKVERPIPSQDGGTWGSDVAAEMLRALDVRYVALNPGASFRGLHDSLVNKLGNDNPQMLLCLHEESAVSLAHGWAKVTDRAMAAVVHSNVGLMHASMSIFNAWCDRMPILLFGATGPVDAAKRRPWIEWIHTCKDQASMIRNYIKWDDEPRSVEALPESMLRARQIAESAPRGPTYICLDVGLQESKVETPVKLPPLARYAVPPASVPPAAQVEAVAARMLAAERPLILLGRGSRSEAAWAQRIKMAESFGAVVLTDMKQAGVFPTTHPLHGAPSGSRITPVGNKLLQQADVVLSLDWVDLDGALKAAWKGDEVTSTIIHISLDQHLHNGWSMDHLGLPPADIYLLGESDATVTALNEAIAKAGKRAHPAWPDRKVPSPLPLPSLEGDGAITVPHLAAALRQATVGRKKSLIHHPLSWSGYLWDIEHPLDFLGSDGGYGIGSGPGLTVGAALALRGGDRLPVSILGDGDYVMGLTAIWTAVHYRIPMLVLVANNHSYYNDELHQERVAVARSRPVDNKWIGQHMVGPELDLATLARGQGAKGFGQVQSLKDLPGVIADAIDAVDAGLVAVVDVRVSPGYYEPPTSA
jgi:thiamine pyrophosphate-dependent acetolactate synthase large subunit-like protein